MKRSWLLNPATPAPEAGFWGLGEEIDRDVSRQTNTIVMSDSSGTYSSIISPTYYIRQPPKYSPLRQRFYQGIPVSRKRVGDAAPTTLPRRRRAVPG